MNTYYQFKLKNGLQIISVPLKNTQAVTVLALLPCGSRYENLEINGVSHFIEHLMFKGTQRRSTTLDISRELDKIGANYNAFTGKDHTGYYIKSAYQHLDLSLDMLADMLFNSKFESTEINRERGVICEEIKMYQDNPLLYIEDLFEQTIFKNNSLGWSIAGPQKNIQQISRQQILNYYQKFYQPHNMVLIVAGKHDSQNLKKKIEQHFKVKNKNQTKQNFKKFKFTNYQPEINILKRQTDQLQLALGFPGVAYDDKRNDALDLLSIILGGNMSSRLFVEVRSKRGLAYYVQADHDSYQDTGCFLIRAGIDKKNLESTLSVINQELNKIKKDGVTCEELQQAQDYLKGKTILTLEDSAMLASFYGAQKLLMSQILNPEEKFKKIDQVKASQIQEIAQEIFTQNKFSLALIGDIHAKQNLKKYINI
ncbi:MAG: pitrilysin family protein [Patescibacteria group bacterium]|nr:pitrilysin family protein [Patescibacteria group bacterium]